MIKAKALAFRTVAQEWYLLIALLLTGLLLVILILKNLRKEPCPMYLPLVPAFSLGALYFLFF